MKPSGDQISKWCEKYNQSPEILTPLIEDVATWASKEERRECVAYLNNHNINSIATNLNFHRASATTSRKESAIFALNEILTVKEINPSPKS
jgi:alpha-D-ribose 1-methylphosphonate 5-triphosphate synthase subunit PhnH